MKMKSAFIDPSTRVLKGYGFVASNEASDIILSVVDDFALQPGLWRHDVPLNDWVAVAPATAQTPAAVFAGIGSIFVGTGPQKAARLADVIEKYPAFSTILLLLRVAPGNMGRPLVIEIANRIKAKIGTGATEILTAGEYANLQALAAANGVAGLFP